MNILKEFFKKEKGYIQKELITLPEHIRLLSELWWMKKHFRDIVNAEKARRGTRYQEVMPKDVVANRHKTPLMGMIDNACLSICNVEHINDARVVAIYEVFSNRSDFINQLQPKETEKIKSMFTKLTLKKSKTLMLTDRFEDIRECIQNNQEIKEAIKKEKETFCTHIFNKVLLAGKYEDNSTTKQYELDKVIIN